MSGNNSEEERQKEKKQRLLAKAKAKNIKQNEMNQEIKGQSGNVIKNTNLIQNQLQTQIKNNENKNFIFINHLSQGLLCNFV